MTEYENPAVTVKHTPRWTSPARRRHARSDEVAQRQALHRAAHLLLVAQDLRESNAQRDVAERMMIAKSSSGKTSRCDEASRTPTQAGDGGRILPTSKSQSFATRC